MRGEAPGQEDESAKNSVKEKKMVQVQQGKCDYRIREAVYCLQKQISMVIIKNDNYIKCYTKAKDADDYDD